MKKLTHEEIVARQVSRMKRPRLSFCAVLDNIRSLNNVGAMFRVADGVGLEKLWLCGITGYPPQSHIAKTALGAEESVAWEYREDAPALVRELKARGYQIVLLEQTDAAIQHDEFVPTGPVCLIVGNEVEGVGEELTALADDAIEIAMEGVKNSLNAAVAFGVAAFAVRAALNKKATGCPIAS